MSQNQIDEAEVGVRALLMTAEALVRGRNPMLAPIGSMIMALVYATPEEMVSLTAIGQKIIHRTIAQNPRPGALAEDLFGKWKPS
jgi:hypothetical protein